ncbi:MAG TPA: TetR/AcrR family transcriptional regulator [Kofleriaceae bacterium]
MVQKETRPRGRPRHFDESEAVARATRTFWDRGYDGVTIDDLVGAMQVARPSFYSVFGDKRALFLRCLKAYAEELGAGAVAALESESVVDAMRGFLAYVVKSATADDSPLGCLLACVAPLVDDAEVRAFILGANAQTIEVVAKRLRAAVAVGELPADFPVAIRARLSLDLSRGLVSRARIGTARSSLTRDANEAVSLLLT